MNKYEFINNAKNYLNYHYLYGYKGEIITQALNSALNREYPKIWNQSNYQYKSKLWIGDRAIDCSGLVCRALGYPIGKDYGSYYMGENWEAVASPAPGLVAWKSGHVAICIDKNHIIEAAGIEAGVRIREFKKSEFKKYLKAPGVDYSEGYTGWHWDEKAGAWQYLVSDKPIKSGVYKLKWSQGESNFIFYNNYCYITDPNGVILQPKL